MLYNRDSDFITVHTRIKAKIWIFFSSHSLSLDFFLHLLTFCLIGDDWNPVMEH